MERVEPTSGRRFASAFTAFVLAVAFAIRWYNGHRWAAVPPLRYDPQWYHQVGDAIATGGGYQIKCPLVPGCDLRPTAYFPPGFPLFLSLGSLVRQSASLDAHLVMACALGTLNVWLTSRVAAAVSTPLAGRIALVIGAGWFNLINLDASLMSEPLALTFVLTAILITLRSAGNIDESSGRHHLLVGLLLGGAAVTRGDLVLAGLFLVWWVTRSPGPARVRRVGLTLLGLALPIALVSVVQSARLDTPVLVSTNSATVLAGANCETTYSGRGIGAWSYECLDAGRDLDLTETEFSDMLVADGRHYVAGHVGQLPRVVLARLGRTFGVFRPFGSDSGVEWGRVLGWIQYAGALVVVLAMRRRLPGPLHSLAIALLLAVATTTALTYGNPRFRYLLEPLVIVALALCLESVWTRHAPQRSPSSHDQTLSPSARTS